MNMDTTIGITGGIGAGKSVVSRILRCNGFYVYDCDYEAKLIMVNDSKVKDALIHRLGEDVYYQDGEINRGKLAQEIFSHEDVRLYVNGVVHKAVRTDIEKKRMKVDGYFFIESAIIATGGLMSLCNQIWLVTAPLEERIKRVIQRDSTDLDSVKKRMESQTHEISLLDSEKTVVLENDNYCSLLPEVLEMTNKLTNQQIYSISC